MQKTFKNLVYILSFLVVVAFMMHFNRIVKNQKIITKNQEIIIQKIDKLTSRPTTAPIIDNKKAVASATAEEI